MKRKLLSCATLAFAMGCLSPVGYAQSSTAEDAKQWLQRMVAATQTLNYEGTFIYVQGARIEAMRIIHSGGAGKGERQRLFSLNGEPREILVANNSVICLLPKQRTRLASAGYQRAPFPLSVPNDLERLEKHYKLQVLGEDRIAGLDTQIISIEPKDHWRYGYKLWLDQRNGMILRSSLLDSQGKAIEHLMFTDLQIKASIDETAFQLPPALLKGEPSSEQAGDNMPTVVDEPVTQSLWQVSQMPQGFVKVLHNRILGSRERRPAEHLVFADGLATISIFLEKLGDEASPLLQGESRLGLMNAYGSLVDGYQVLVVGEVPVATVQRIAVSIRRDAEALAHD